MDFQLLKNEYDQQGFIRVRHFLSEADLRQVRQALERYVTEIAPTLPEADRVFEADGKAVRNLWRMDRHDPFFEKLAGRPEIRDLVRTLVNGEPVLMGVETFNKPARVGSGVPPHQDNAYFCQSPPDVLTIWIAIDAATAENGPIYYLKGSNRQMVDHRPSGVAGNSMGVRTMPEHDSNDEFAGTLEPGDAMIHHSQTVHWSAPNRSERSRCGLLFVFRGAHTSFDASLKAAYDAAAKARS